MPDHESIESWVRDSMSWPQYFVCGGDVAENFVATHYKVEGPNGAVSYKKPNGEEFPTTMYDFAMDAHTSDDFHWCRESESLWDDE